MPGAAAVSHRKERLGDVPVQDMFRSVAAARTSAGSGATSRVLRQYGTSISSETKPSK